MILADNTMTNEVHSWQDNGHEIGVHHHGPRHRGWNGYTNMPEEEAYDIRDHVCPQQDCDAIETYLGTVDSYMPKFNQLASPYKIKSGTVTDKWTDVPSEIIYDVDGFHDGRTGKVTTNIWNNHLVYRISIFLGVFKESKYNEAVSQYNSLGPEEVFGAVAHVYNFQQTPAGIESWFKFLKEKDPEGLKRKTVTWIMENHILPNNYISTERCGNKLCDSEERMNNSCTVDCGKCNFYKRDCETAELYIPNK